jgi:hypothetical protein
MSGLACSRLASSLTVKSIIAAKHLHPSKQKYKQKRPTDKGGANVFGGGETLKNKLPSDMRGPFRGKGRNQ